MPYALGGVLRAGSGIGNVLAGIADRLQTVVGGVMKSELALLNVSVGLVRDILARTPRSALDTLLIELLVYMSCAHANLLRGG